MARNIGAQCKQCRREGQKLFLKGSRCFTDKCGVERRSYPPGEHGRGRMRQSEYRAQLREKQKAKRIYGVLESQFRRYFAWAESEKGVTGENLLKLLERRLDNVVFRLGFATSRAEARQLVRHGHFRVNGRKAAIPSMLLRPGDTIQLRERSQQVARVTSALDALEGKSVPQWLEIEKAQFKGTVKTSPAREDITMPIQEQLIVELYSK